MCYVWGRGAARGSSRHHSAVDSSDWSEGAVQGLVHSAEMENILGQGVQVSGVGALEDSEVKL